jgi:hypothetical protein
LSQRSFIIPALLDVLEPQAIMQAQAAFATLDDDNDVHWRFDF